jgi:hypothetical protein
MVLLNDNIYIVLTQLNGWGLESTEKYYCMY